MANTADILGEQETLDGLVTHTLEDFEDNRITAVRQYAFYKNSTIKSINLQNAKEIKDCSFYNCYSLKTLIIPNVKIISPCLRYCNSLNNLDWSNIEKISSLEDSGFGSLVLPECNSVAGINGYRVSTIDAPKMNGIGSNFAAGAYSLVHIIFREDRIYPLYNDVGLNRTPFINGLGWVYVPTDLVDSYKTATNWSAYADQIVSIDEYPKALDGETITDSWDEIFQAEDNDTYKTKYNVGDTKYLIIGGTYVLMQIIAFDRDILSSDNTSTAKITWLAKSLSFIFPMNFMDKTGGWAECDCRKFLNDTIYEQIPENVRNRILLVDKTYTTTSVSSSTTTASDKVWIPSHREMFGGTLYENSGIDYTDFFTNNSSRIKHRGLLADSAVNWLLRSVSGPSHFRVVSNTGGGSNVASSSNNEIAIGFCT